MLWIVHLFRSCLEQLLSSHGISNTLLFFLLFGSLGNFGGDFVVCVRFNWWLLSLVEEGLFIFQRNHVSLFLICWSKRRLEFGFMLQLGNLIITWMMRLLLLLCRMVWAFEGVSTVKGSLGLESSDGTGIP